MAKVTMTIEDKPEGDGGFTVNFEFDPPIKRGVTSTAAQVFGAQIADACTGQGEVLEGFCESEDEEDDSL